MTERRKFTDNFKFGDYVRITRSEHGWHNNDTLAKIIQIEEYRCLVLGEDGLEYNILKPRDISLTNETFKTQRVLEKQKDRQRDWDSLKNGTKTVDQLNKENSISHGLVDKFKPRKELGVK